MNIAYGIKVTDVNDPYISTAEEVMGGMAQAAVPGNFLVDLLPILKYVPSWIPGAGFKQKGAYWRRVTVDMVEKPFEYVKEALVSSACLTKHLSFVDIWIPTVSGECSVIHSSDDDRGFTRRK
jgi:hypothetical protein